MNVNGMGAGQGGEFGCRLSQTMNCLGAEYVVSGVGNELLGASFAKL